MTKIINIKNKIDIDSILYFILLLQFFFPKLVYDIKIGYLDFSHIGYLSILALVILKKGFNLFFFQKNIILFNHFFYITLFLTK